MEILDHIRHQHYVNVHSRDGKYPLDGSDWARLVAMRMRSHQNDRAGKPSPGFWLRLHSANSPLHHERKVFHRGMNHWFTLGNAQYEAPWRYSCKAVSDDPVWLHLVNKIDGQMVGVDSKGNLQIEDGKRAAENNPYWANAEREGVEGATPVYRRLRTATGKWKVKCA